MDWTALDGHVLRVVDCWVQKSKIVSNQVELPYS